MESVNININVPSSWEELDDKMLRYVYALIAKDFTIDEVKVLVLLKWGGCRVLGRSEGQSFLLSFGKEVAVVQCAQLAQVMTALDWLENIPATPVRLKKIRRHRPVAGDFQGVPFGNLIIVENLYQGFLSTRNDAMLDELAAVLYPGLSGKLAPEERIGVFYWVAALKNMLQRGSLTSISRLPTTSRICSALNEPSELSFRRQWTRKSVRSQKATSLRRVKSLRWTRGAR